MPWVPGPSTTVGRGPLPVHGPDGTRIVPVTAIGCPVAFVLVYITRVVDAEITAGVPGMIAATEGSERRTEPGGVSGRTVGGL